jgi:hypothetical protein
LDVFIMTHTIKRTVERPGGGRRQFHIRISKGRRRGHIDVMIISNRKSAASPFTALESRQVASFIVLEARQITMAAGALLVETLSPMVYVFIGRDILRVCTLAPVIAFANTTGPFAVDVMNNYYLFEEHVIIRNGPCGIDPCQYYRDRAPPDCEQDAADGVQFDNLRAEPMQVTGPAPS